MLGEKRIFMINIYNQRNYKIYERKTPLIKSFLGNKSPRDIASL